MICVSYIFYPLFLFVWGFIKPIINWFTFNKAVENSGEINNALDNNNDEVNNVEVTNNEVTNNEDNDTGVNDGEVNDNEFSDNDYYYDYDNNDDEDNDNDEKLSQTSIFSCICTNKQLPRDPANKIKEIENLLKELIEASYTNKKCV